MSLDGFVTKILDALFEKKKNTDEEFCNLCRTASPQEIQNAISSGANVNGRNELSSTLNVCCCFKRKPRINKNTRQVRLCTATA